MGEKTGLHHFIAVGVLDQLSSRVASGFSAFTDRESDVVGLLFIAGVEVDVVGDQEFAG